MRFPRSWSLFAVLCLIALQFSSPRHSYADTILIGTDLSNATHGGAAVLCPQGSNCSDRASQFTLSSAALINSISVVVSSGPGLSTDGSFTVGLGSLLGTGVTTGIGSGDILVNPNGPVNTEEFTFTGLDLFLAPGTYYLGMAGSNVQWDYAPPLLTTVGTLGLQLSCDPYITCGSDITRWDRNSFEYAMQINGTDVAPEPSSLLLLATGLAGATFLFTRRRALI